MADEAKITVDEELHVNEATLELLRKRIEAGVRKQFLTQMGVPLLILGVVVIALCVLVWIPSNVETLIAESPQIQRTLRLAAERFLTDPEQGEKLVLTEAREVTEEQLAEAVRAQLESEHSRKLIEDKVAAAVQSYFEGDEGTSAVAAIVERNLNSESMSQLLREAVDQTLRPDAGDGR